MTITENSVQIAETLRKVYQTKTPCAPIREQMTKQSLEEAYAIQQVNTDYWIKKGRRLTGRKIGLTSKSVQTQLGVDQPDFGMLFADMAYGSGDIIDSSLLLQPKAEAEICLVLEKDLSFEKHTVQDIIAATAYALPSIEIVDSRIKDWKIKIYDTIADNASSAMYVLGSTPIPLSKIDVELCGMVIERMGEPVSTGAGIACLGNPLNAAVWLADKMVEVGMPLKAGDLILTGALGPMININPGDSIRSRISGLGEINIHFSKTDA